MPLSTEFNPRQARILVVLIIVVVLGALYMYVFAPQAQRLTQARARLEEANAMLAIDLVKIGRAPQSQEELELAIAELESCERLIPREDRVHYIFRDIESVARANHVAVQSMTTAKGKPRGQYVEIPVTINISGTYNQIIAFLDGIADLGRIMNVHSLSFAGGREGRQGDGTAPSTDVHISATIQVTTYARPKGGGQVGAGS